MGTSCHQWLSTVVSGFQSLLEPSINRSPCINDKTGKMLYRRKIRVYQLGNTKRLSFTFQTLSSENSSQQTQILNLLHAFY